MWKIGFSCLVMLFAGCASSPGTGLISPMSEELKKSNKDIDSAWREWKAPYVKAEDNRRLNTSNTEYIPIDDKQLMDKRHGLHELVDLTANTIVTELADYCAAHGGTKTLATCTPKNFLVQCEDGQNNRVNTPPMFGPNSLYAADTSLYFNCRRGNENLIEVGVGRGTLRAERTLHKLFVITDSPQRQANDRALSPSDLDEYHLLKNPATIEHRRLYELIARFDKKDDPENLLPTARERLNELTQQKIAGDKAAVIASAAAAERAAQLKRQDFLTSVNTGALVCRTVQASVDVPTGIAAMGRPQTATVQGKAKIVGYVNQRANHKLQIHISSINFRWVDDSYRSHEQELDSLNHFQGSAALRANGIIWDGENDWEFCNQ